MEDLYIGKEEKREISPIKSIFFAVSLSLLFIPYIKFSGWILFPDIPSIIFSLLVISSPNGIITLIFGFLVGALKIISGSHLYSSIMFIVSSLIITLFPNFFTKNLEGMLKCILLSSILSNTPLLVITREIILNSLFITIKPTISLVIGILIYPFLKLPKEEISIK